MKNLILILLFISCIAWSQDPVNHTYPLTDGPDKNPLKGWNSGWWDDNPDATVGFQYIKWNEFEPTNGNFNFSYIEDLIDRPGSRGRHVILRLYADWYGTDPTSQAGPSWLYSDFGVGRFQYGGKYITDYNNANYISQVIEAIEALADRYDNDPRIYAIQLGVLGYWGEWHTFTYDDPNFDIEENTKDQIIQAYKDNFTNKQLMGRYPWRAPLSSTGGIGFHNDFFVPNNGHSDEFDDAIDQNNKWREGPVGGEAPPIDDNDSASFMFDLYQTNKGMSMIETGHYSTMKMNSDEKPSCADPNDAQCQGYMALHRKMGYNYQISSAVFPEIIGTMDDLSITLTIDNIGVAPIYYDWDVQFALLNSSNEPQQIFETNYDLRTILDNDSATITKTDALNLAVGDYKLAVRFIQPGADANKNEAWKLDARNAYILFSNDMSTVTGQWNGNNALTGGWSILGSIEVQEGTLSIEDYNALDNRVVLYPVPSKSNLTMTKTTDISLLKASFRDMTGRLVYTYDLSKMNTSEEIDISNLSSGMYHVIINAQEGEIRKKIIKQ